MDAPVFISYARKTSLTEARALKASLKRRAFLDESEIETRERFTEVIAKAIMGARIAVVFADDTYFDRPYCRWEWNLIQSAPGTDHIFVTVPHDAEYALDALPPDLRDRNWSTADLPAAVGKQLKKSPPPIGTRIAEPDREYLLESSYQQAQLPPVLTQALAKIPHRWVGQLDVSSQATFVGRARLLQDIHQRLVLAPAGTGAVALTAAVLGGGGFGKSRLAAEYVLRHAPRNFTGGVFWLQCEQAMEDQFFEVVRILNPGTQPIQALRENKVDIPQLLRHEVQQVVGQGKRVLFVLDNVPEVDGKLKPLEEFCPARGLAASLITSRQKQGSVPTLDVDALHPTDAWLLLTANLRNRGELTRAEWDEIGAWVGHLPLALEILNRALVNRARPFAEILRRARQQETSPELDELAEALPEIQRGVTETFEISYQALSPEVQKAARLLAELGPEPIPFVLLDALEIVAPKVRADLVGHAFVTATSPTDEFGAMHRVLASFLREKSRLSGESVEVEYFGAQRATHATAVRARRERFQIQAEVPRSSELEAIEKCPSSCGVSL